MASTSGWGLSPRVRGNQPRWRRAGGGCRSIPACTGKPGCLPSPSRCLRVYPRVYGETHVIISPWNHNHGLSPRVRGNRRMRVRLRSDNGSIPACTGKPESLYCRVCICKVYPRVYGETFGLPGFVTPVGGLSPRVRGNPPLPASLTAWGRSIPACTGKPGCLPSPSRCLRVYPRVYGETANGGGGGTRGQGLSPRVRGNLALRSR